MKKADLENPVSIQWIETYLRKWYSISFYEKSWVELEEMPISIYKLTNNFGLKSTRTYVEEKDVQFIVNYCKKYIIDNFNKIPCVYISGMMVHTKSMFKQTANAIMDTFEKSCGIIPDRDGDGNN